MNISAPDFDSTAFAKDLRMSRQRRKLSVRELAAMAGVGKNTITRLEQGKPSTAVVRHKVVSAFGVSVEAFGRPQPLLSENVVTYSLDMGRWAIYMNMPNPQARKFDSDRIQSEAERLRLGRLGWVTRFENLQPHRHSQTRGGSMNVMEIWKRNGVPSQHLGEEFVYVVRGDIRLIVGEESFALHQGEGATFLASEPHDYEPLKPLGPRDLPPLALYVKLDL